MKWYLPKLMKWKVAFEYLAEAKLINLEDEPNYWRVLDDIDEIYKRYYVII